MTRWILSSWNSHVLTILSRESIFIALSTIAILICGLGYPGINCFNGVNEINTVTDPIIRMMLNRSPSKAIPLLARNEKTSSCEVSLYMKNRNLLRECAVLFFLFFTKNTVSNKPSNVRKKTNFVPWRELSE